MNLAGSLVTAALTIVGSVLVFVVSQIVQRLVIEPVVDQRKAIGEIDYLLTYWAWAYANPGDFNRDRQDAVAETLKGVDAIRASASRLLSATNGIRSWRIAKRLSAIDPHSANEAAGLLIGISNAFFGHAEDGRNNKMSATTVRRLLSIPLDGRRRE